MRFTCSVSGCESFVLARSLCKKHYYATPAEKRLEYPRRYGQGIKWLRKLVEYEGDDCVKWPWATDKAGYGRIWFEGKLWVTSRLMCVLVRGEPPTASHVAAHSCGRGGFGCVTPRHLRWATETENAQDKFSHGTQPLGEIHWATRRRRMQQRMLGMRRLLRSILMDRLLNDPRNNAMNVARKERQ